MASPEPPSYAESAFLSKHTSKFVSSAFQPRIAVMLEVSARWYMPLIICRAVCTAPAAWWGFRCAFTFLGELLYSVDLGACKEEWDVEKRFRVTEVFLAILWVSRVGPSLNLEPSIQKANNGSGYSVPHRCTFHISLRIVLCLGGRLNCWNQPTHLLRQNPRLLNYTPSATCIRLLTLDALIAYITTQTLYLSGASQDPRMLLPAWIGIASVNSHLVGVVSA